MFTKNIEKRGSDLVSEFEDFVASLKGRAEERAPIVRERLAALEAEEADLRQLLRRLEAAGRKA